jgi:glutaredoxin
VRADPWTVYGRPNCPWCDKVKKLLDRYGIEYLYIDLSQNPQVRTRLIRDGHTTVPVVFHMDQLIGGYEATEGYLEVRASV